jgi:SSS family transporter
MWMGERMSQFARIACYAVMLLLAATCPAGAETGVELVWEKLPEAPLQDAPAHFGVHKGALILVGQECFVLPPGAAAWQPAPRISAPTNIAAAASTSEGMWLLPEAPGGLVTRLAWTGNNLVASEYPEEAALRAVSQREREGIGTLGPEHELRVGLPGHMEYVNAYTGTPFALGPLPGGTPWNESSVLLIEDNHPILVIDSTRMYRGAFVRPPSRLGMVDYGAIGLYLAALVGMGAYFSRREKTTEQFFLGGRKIPWWAVGLSIFGTSISSITYLSIPAQAYATNWVYFNANMAIPLVAPVVTLFYISHYRKWPIATAYEYLERRFNLLTRLYGSVCFLIFQTGRVGIVMLLPAIALSAATGMDKGTCIIVMGVLATMYTVMGGIEAVIWTDVLQAIVLTCGAVLALVLIVIKVDGGVVNLVREAAANDKFHMIEWSWDPASTALWVVLIGNAFMNLYPMTADQTVVQRYLSTPNVRDAKRAVWTNALLTIPITVLFFSLGTALWAYFRQHPQYLDPTLQNDAIIPLFVTIEFPIGLKGVLIAGIFAAAMSSLDSSINSVASVLVNDYYRRFVAEVSERRAFFAARLTTLLFGGIGTAVAFYAAQINAPSLWGPFLSLLSYVGSGIAGVFALGVFTTRANGIGAVCGAIASAAAVYGSGYTDIHNFVKGIIGVVVAFAVGYTVSLITQPLDPPRGQEV